MGKSSPTFLNGDPKVGPITAAYRKRRRAKATKKGVVEAKSSTRTKVARTTNRKTPKRRVSDQRSPCSVV